MGMGLINMRKRVRARITPQLIVSIQENVLNMLSINKGEPLIINNVGDVIRMSTNSGIIMKNGSISIFILDPHKVVL